MADALTAAALRYTPMGKTIVITGGTQGLGRAAIEEMGPLKAKIFTCARNADDLKELLEHCAHQGWDVKGLVADVSSPEGRQALLEGVKTAFGDTVDVLINNVGTNIKHKPTVEVTDEEFSFLMKTNLESAFCLTRDFYTALKASGAGCVLFISSVAGGPTAMRSGPLYGMTKASMNLLTKSLACEWGADNIRVLSIAPWYTKTPLAMRSLANKDFEEMVLSRTPMKRVAEPEEVARVMAFLASPAASYMTGATITVDGGYSSMGLY